MPFANRIPPFYDCAFLFDFKKKRALESGSNRKVQQSSMQLNVSGRAQANMKVNVLTSLR
jgi:hypothetical protein